MHLGTFTNSFQVIYQMILEKQISTSYMTYLHHKSRGVFLFVPFAANFRLQNLSIKSKIAATGLKRSTYSYNGRKTTTPKPSTMADSNGSEILFYGQSIEKGLNDLWRNPLFTIPVRRNRQPEPNIKNYHTPERDRDVKFGRGPGCSWFNMAFREFCLSKFQEYSKADSRADKRRIRDEVIRWVKNHGGQFLKEDSEGWYIHSAIAVQTKVSTM